MTLQRVLRIARSDLQDAFVLVHVVSNGPDTLDLALTATEGECPYAASVRHSRIRDLRVKNYQGSEEEWTRIISHVLGQPADAHELASVGIETSASISGFGDEGEMIITIRNRVQSITQRLGTLVLKQDDEQAIELFAWSGVAASRADELEQQVTKLSGRYRVAEDTIQNLNKQLEELLRAKDHHETQLVANFAQLLNEKKLKVRNQQRLLASATVDTTKGRIVFSDIGLSTTELIVLVSVSEIQAAAGDPRHATETHRAGKRPAHDMEQTDGESDEGFELMDIDETRVDDGSQLDQDTDQATDENTDHEIQSSPQPPVMKPVVQVEASTQQNSARTAPPKRELPFVRREQSREDAEETAGESDDDEL
ncbi:hypothetical protein N7448_000888 [Penicillium atrosanguineum]|uniref:Uncharacterized protein n=1 Tax=Penicillium atrosanguineum TaxID=1132637 RepID=A0A9W9LCZ3_9EURO|nr:Protein transport protein SEC61 subunit alpha [Penicillium atrosanguineum]KAJ5134091.1 hypothetical protein N7526_005456 [Penicillium atrosanguineum]KAJ5149310.1 hypothetical protein N7448_000888 [Penicillium atrosanguineum]KAJ5304622.1 Protein transport protein SEC61 subunit alpha [Penicillium atrosanguineum]KAJ5324090.1 hypothetical protein N7476_002690 [Penicillium atrosanguineum]